MKDALQFSTELFGKIFELAAAAGISEWELKPFKQFQQFHQPELFRLNLLSAVPQIISGTEFDLWFIVNNDPPEVAMYSYLASPGWPNKGYVAGETVRAQTKSRRGNWLIRLNSSVQVMQIFWIEDRKRLIG